jgi:excinuclease ABC subunit C
MITFNPKVFLATLTHKPGVYCMLNNAGTVLYVGKARNLKKRVASYFTQSTQSPKTRALVAQIAKIEVTVTHTENEALILENTLIKSHQPRYNILFRDDKSYPYIYLSEHPFPRLGWHRPRFFKGKNRKNQKRRYFGPYPDVRALHETLKLLQELFLIRQCEESVFRNRSRPCLQYQIKRCSAPCVGLVDEASYHEDVQQAVLLLEGKSQTALVEKMNAAKEALEYEKAAKYRDQIRSLIKIQEPQYVSIDGGDIDIIAAVTQARIGCVQVLTIRDGRQIGNQAFFPQHSQDAQNLLLAFLPQYYLAPSRDIPNEIILNQEIEEVAVIASVISQQRGKQVYIHSRVRGTRARWVEMALENARTSLVQRSQYADRLTALI